MSEDRFNKARSDYLETFTFPQAQEHNRIHEALLINGYEWRFVPFDLEDDGDGESGPCVAAVTPAHFEYKNEQEYIITEFGEIVFREKRDIEFEKFLNEQQDCL